MPNHRKIVLLSAERRFATATSSALKVIVIGGGAPTGRFSRQPLDVTAAAEAVSRPVAARADCDTRPVQVEDCRSYSGGLNIICTIAHEATHRSTNARCIQAPSLALHPRRAPTRTVCISASYPVDADATGAHQSGKICKYDVAADFPWKETVLFIHF